LNLEKSFQKFCAHETGKKCVDVGYVNKKRGFEAPATLKTIQSQGKNNMNQENSARKYLYGHTSPETAYEVEDYPWGFRLRTKIRYWIESKINYGQRFCSQTVNPKTGRWCAPRMDTYSEIEVLYLNEDDHVRRDILIKSSSLIDIENFKKIHLDNLDQFQKNQLINMIAIENVMKHVEVKFTPCPIGPISLFSRDPMRAIQKSKLRLKNARL
jgi:hypothetical protein